MFKLVLSLLIIAMTASRCVGKIDCAMGTFSGDSTSSHRVFCGDGYHECYVDACCSDVVALPVELTLVILGPSAAVISSILTIFVLKVVISSALADRSERTIRIDPHTVQ